MWCVALRFLCDQGCSVRWCVIERVAVERLGVSLGTSRVYWPDRRGAD